MKLLTLRPKIYQYSDCKGFLEDFQIGKGDLVLTNQYIYNPYFGQMQIEADVLFQEKYGSGEPSDEMVEAICGDMRSGYKRIFAIGGGTIIDIAKILALKNITPVLDLFDRKLPVEKDKELVIVPTTCGTGSEVTNISILELKSRKTKLGLADEVMYADYAVLIPQLLESLPYRFFATSSIDALIHAVESSVSPNATSYSKLFGFQAIEMILRGYQKIAEEGEMARLSHLEEFLVASNYAGIAFGNAGVGAVHAMSYPLGGAYHVAHGEANYALFIRVFEHYASVSTQGALGELNALLGDLLHCGPSQVYGALGSLLERILPRKRLSEYGMTAEDIPVFTENVMEKQKRLTANNFVPMDKDQVAAIYRDLL